MMRALGLLTATSMLFLFSIIASMGQSMLVDDFQSGPEKRWRFFADTVMGGVSSGNVEFATKDGVSFARLTGDVSTANNGGFIQIRHELETALQKISREYVWWFVATPNGTLFICEPHGPCCPGSIIRHNMTYHQIGRKFAFPWPAFNAPGNC